MENYDVREVVSQEAGDVSKGEPPIKAITEKVTPNEYRVEIKPEDWKLNVSVPECEIVVPGIHESCICNVYPDDDMISNKASDREYAQQLIKDIYAGDLSIDTDVCKIKCRFVGETPKATIYLDLVEYPFFDTPGSKFGL